MRGSSVIGQRPRARTAPAWLPFAAAAVATIASLGAACTALAQTSSLSLTWQAPAECPDEAFVRNEIDRLLAEGPPPAAQIEAHAVVSRIGERRWRVHIETIRDGVAGERSIEAASCRPLAEATALIVVLAIDPSRVRPPDEGSAASSSLPGPSPGPPARARGAPFSPSPPEPPARPSPSAHATIAPAHAPTPSGATPLARRRTMPVHWDVFAAVGGDIGTLPGPAIGAALTAGVLVGPVRLEAYGAHWFGRATGQAQIAEGQTTASYGGTISLSNAGTAGCFGLGFGRFEVAPCLGIEFGQLHGVGSSSIETPGPNDGLWVAVVGALHGMLRVAGPLWVGLRIQGVVPLIRDRFVANINEQTLLVFRPFPVEGRGFLGPELRF